MRVTAAPDVQQFPFVAAAIVTIYNIPEIQPPPGANPADYPPLILDGFTLPQIFIGTSFRPVGLCVSSLIMFSYADVVYHKRCDD